jgi:hypothetical protein
MNFKALWTTVVMGFVAACARMPGETLTSGGLQRDVKARVLSLASTVNPACGRRSIVNTDVLELHPDGRVAVERWTVEQCGQRLVYRVNLPPARGASNFSITPEA